MQPCEYLKVNIAHPSWNGLRNALEAHFHQHYPGHTLSVNSNEAGTMAWVKVAEGHGRSGVAITNKVGRDGHSTVRNEVNHPSWRPTPPNRP